MLPEGVLNPDNSLSGSAVLARLNAREVLAEYSSVGFQRGYGAVVGL